MNTRSVLVLLVSLVLVFGLYGPAETQEDISGQEVASGPAASDVPDVPDATGESDASDEADVPDESDEADTSPSDETVSDPSVSPEKTAFEPDLESFGAVALNDMSLCQEDEGCLEEVAMIKSWVCISKACRSKKDPTFKAVECLGKVNDTGKPDALSLAMCDYARSSDPEKRKEFLSHAVKTSPNATEDALVQIKAYLMALKGKRKDCVNLVKDYVGPYGPNWSYKWYRVIAACRILSKERTYKDEERDFINWSGDDFCPLITNPDLSEACEAVGGDFSF